jgi:hypothetical protein
LTARISRVNRGIDLNEILKCIDFDSISTCSADKSLADGLSDTERVAYRKDNITDSTAL